MEIIHRSVTWYQQKIGSYDKQLWEQSVEQKVLKGIQQAPRRSVKPKTELIDVDLVRGSTFSKVKPQVPWTYITIKTFSRVVLFPFHYRWWIQQTSFTFWLFLMFLYSVQIFTIFIFLCNVEVEVFGDEHSLSEVFTPCILMVLLGMIHSQTVLTHLKPPVRDNKRVHHPGIKSRGIREGWRRKRSLSQNRSGSDVLINSTGVGSDVNTSQSKTNIKTSHGSRLLRERTKDRKTRLKGSSSRSNVRPENPSQDSESAYNTYEESTLDKGSSADVDSVSSASKKDDDDQAVEQIFVDKKSAGLKRRCESQESDLPEDSNSEDELGKIDADDKESSKRFSQSISSDNDLDFDSLKSVDGNVQSGSMDKTDNFVSTMEMNPDSVLKVSGADGAFKGVNSESVTTDQDVKVKVVRSDLNVKLKFEGPSCMQRDTVDIVVKSDNVGVEKDNKTLLDKNDTMLKSDALKCSRNSSRQTKDTDDSLFKNLASRKNMNKREIVHVNRKYFSGANGLNEHKIHDKSLKTDSENSSLSSLERDRSPVPAHIASSVHFTLDKQREATPKGSRETTPTHTQSDVILQAKHARGGNLSTKSSDSESEDNEKTCKSLPNVRRRKVTLQDGSEISGSILRNRRQPGSLGMRETKSTTTVVSSSEGETEGQSSEYSREGRRNMASSEEWGDHLQSGLDTTSESSSCGSEPEISTQEVPEQESENESPASPQPHGVSASTAQVINLLHPSSSQSTTHSPPDKVTCIIWEGNECKKIELTAIDIGWAIIETVHKIPESSDYVLIGITFSILMGLTPLLYHSFHAKDIASIMTWSGVYQVIDIMTQNSWSENLIHLNGVIQRLCLSAIFFFMLSVADKTFKQRLLYAKHFCYLTSSRRARKFDMPHFRLNKVRNIRSWLSLRSYLKKRGPQRSVDVIVSSSFLITLIIWILILFQTGKIYTDLIRKLLKTTIEKRGPQRSVDVIVSSSFLITLIMLILICLQLLRDTEIYLNYLCNWELLVWCMALGVYLLRFMNLGLRINKKYRNLSVLITEQINLYLQMEQKPHKKEELMVANNVLKLAESLLKELESPFKISGISANPLVLNITRVVVLSAFSAVLTELLGFKLKLYKIKLRP